MSCPNEWPKTSCEMSDVSGRFTFCSQECVSLIKTSLILQCYTGWITIYTATFHIRLSADLLTCHHLWNIAHLFCFFYGTYNAVPSTFTYCRFYWKKRFIPSSTDLFSTLKRLLCVGTAHSYSSLDVLEHSICAAISSSDDMSIQCW